MYQNSAATAQRMYGIIVHLHLMEKLPSAPVYRGGHRSLMQAIESKRTH